MNYNVKFTDSSRRILNYILLCVINFVSHLFLYLFVLLFNCLLLLSYLKSQISYEYCLGDPNESQSCHYELNAKSISVCKVTMLTVTCYQHQYTIHKTTHFLLAILFKKFLTPFREFCLCQFIVTILVNVFYSENVLN